jgi:hypothetical protein
MSNSTVVKEVVVKVIQPMSDAAHHWMVHGFGKAHVRAYLPEVMPPWVRDIVHTQNGKAFFYARLVNGNWAFKSRAPDQPW